MSGFIFLLIFFVLAGVFNDIRGPIYGLIWPVQASVYRAGNKTVTYFRSVFFLGSLIQKNQQLQEQNIKLKIDDARIEEVMKENELLRKQLGLPSGSEPDFVLANMSGRCASNYNRCALIDAGRRQGVVEGAAVTAFGGVLVGRVAEVYDLVSVVLLINDAASAVNVITRETLASGILRGGGDGGLILEMVSPDKNIEVGEEIMTVIMGNVFPQGLLIGEVSDIISKDVDISKRARIKPAVSVSQIEKVLIIKE